MRYINRWLIITLLTFILGIPGCASPPPKKERSVIFQHSAITALLEGVYEADVTVSEIAAHGNFGIGTFEGLDGEMIVLDGVFYQIRANGRAYRVPDEMKTPFAVVTFFRGGTVIYPQPSLDFQGLTDYLDSLIPTKNIFYAIRIDGTFKKVKTRSVGKQAKPYPRLVDALKKQKEFELKNVRGTLVGFRFPAYAGGVNVPGYHLHFITAERKAGGHVLELETDVVSARTEAVHDFQMVLPHNNYFYHADLTKEKKGDLDKVEKSKAPAR